MLLPKPRGGLSDRTWAALRDLNDNADLLQDGTGDNDEDAAITLWALHELSYRGFEDVDDDAEWDPDVMSLRRQLEVELETGLRARWPGPPDVDDFSGSFFDVVAAHDGASVARYVQTDATEEQVLDLLRMRSIYHLKEADPTAWVIPRLPVVPQAALAELQYDEYGAGDPNQMHRHLFARGMEACGLRPEYGVYIDDTPTEILEQSNALSMFGLHRRLRGAALGHLAAFEATSSVPSRRLAQGMERLGFPEAMVAYYTEHVEADAVHEQLAVRTICQGLLDEEPGLADDVWFGAFTCLDLEDRGARMLLARWGAQT